MTDFESLSEGLIQGDIAKVTKNVQDAVDKQVPVNEILKDGLIASMSIVGERFKRCDMFLPEVIRCANAMKAGVAVIKPLFEKSGVEPLAKLVMGTVKGDLHDIGKNLVIMMLEANGFEVVDLGIDVPPEKFVDSVKDTGTRICMMSALLTTTIPAMRKTIEALEAAGLGEVKTLVGGAPLNEKYAQEIGASGYGDNAGDAVDLVKELLSV